MQPEPEPGALLEAMQGHAQRGEIAAIQRLLLTATKRPRSLRLLARYLSTCLTGSIPDLARWR